VVLGRAVQQLWTSRAAQLTDILHAHHDGASWRRQDSSLCNHALVTKERMASGDIAIYINFRPYHLSLSLRSSGQPTQRRAFGSRTEGSLNSSLNSLSADVRRKEKKKEKKATQG
jgi:hypothetical protein